ncbi:hypothetical protein RSOLAG1IB_05684 [Rhizoctonia solani AG-1 IB]|uniref:Uncharacterized protein n=1 Tax=Thanatephorus cucumeris (strain AG1-IB / isolate 7/3/14) TaxID=1108050 RepID=A0A0B7G481_THACB|nr:hypothetical protein RSOLAG1IB_05684 [Rhizoctonia solani AG-1 IB]
MPFSAEAVVGKVEATLGEVLHNPSLKEKGLAKQHAAAEKAPVHHSTEPAPTGIPQHNHKTAEKQLAAEAGPGETILAGGGGRPAV